MFELSLRLLKRARSDKRIACYNFMNFEGSCKKPYDIQTTVFFRNLRIKVLCQSYAAHLFAGWRSQSKNNTCDQRSWSCWMGLSKLRLGMMQKNPQANETSCTHTPLMPPGGTPRSRRLTGWPLVSRRFFLKLFNISGYNHYSYHLNSVPMKTWLCQQLKMTFVLKNMNSNFTSKSFCMFVDYKASQILNILQ